VRVAGDSLWLAAGITLRFAVFAMGNVKDFADPAHRSIPTTWRGSGRFTGTCRATPLSRVTPRPRCEAPPNQFVNAAVQWEYQDPTIQITPYEYEPLRSKREIISPKLLSSCSTEVRANMNRRAGDQENDCFFLNS